MVTKEEVLALIGEGESYASVARRLGIPPGQAYLVATGLPADGSDSLSPEDRTRPGIRFGSVQEMVNPRREPDSKPAVAMTWLRGRADSDAVMQEAASKRPVGAPRIPQPDGEDEADDVVEVLGRDHNQVSLLVKELQATPAFSSGGTEEDAARRQSLLGLMTRLLTTHESAEESVFWPAVEEWLGDEGREYARTAREQEERTKDLLAELERMGATEGRFDDLLSQLISLRARHLAHEDTVFLEVREKVPPAERAAVGRKLAASEGSLESS